MILIRFALLVAGTAVPATILGNDVRLIEPARQSMLPTTPADTKAEGAAKADPSELKPTGRDVPSPILVERTATIDAAGNVVLGCGNARLHDFSKKKPAGTPPETSR